MTDRGIAVAMVAVLVSIGLSSTAQASTASEERTGARILRSVDNGDRACAELDRDDFEKVGDYVMGRMTGSIASHERMDSLMSNMMGASTADEMHVVMGRRFTGCGRGRVPGAFSAMMGMMGDFGGGGMMGNPDTTTGTDEGSGDLGAAGWAVFAVLAVLAVLAASAMWLWRPGNRAPRGSAIGILNERYARGEIDADEFEQRRRALEAPGRR